MPLKECRACSRPIELPDLHNVCIFCLGHAHAEATLDRSDRSFCEKMTVSTLRAMISTILNCAPPIAIEPWKDRLRQPHAVGPLDVRTSMQVQCAHHSGSLVSYTKSFHPSDEAHNLVSFGTAGEDDVVDEDVTSTVTPDSSVR